MKVKELIAQLEKCDPECEVVVGREPVTLAEQVEGYWDGHYEALICREGGNGVVGVRITSRGDKVRLHTLSAYDALYNCRTEEEIDRFIIENDLTYISANNNADRMAPYEKMREEARWFRRMMDAEFDKERGPEHPDAVEANKKWNEYVEEREGK